MIPPTVPSSSQCPLCQEKHIERILPDINKRMYWRCPSCYLLFMDGSQLPTPENEKARYNFHHNENNDPKYISFISPMIESIKPYINKTMVGLDYGCGPNPVLADLMRSQEYNIAHFDPYYFPIIGFQMYDYITCTEVVEHFHKVALEWFNMVSMLKPGGYLGIMTHLYDDTIDLHGWYYLRDFTHTAFYHSRTFSFIADHWKLKLCTVKNNRIAIFQKMQ